MVSLRWIICLREQSAVLFENISTLIPRFISLFTCSQPGGGEKVGWELEWGEETGVGGGVRVILKCRKFAADELLTHGKWGAVRFLS